MTYPLQHAVSPLALPGLAHRAHYRPSGFFKPVFLLYFVSACCLAIVMGFAGGWLMGAAPFADMGPMSLLAFMIPVLAAMILSFHGMWIIKAGAVRRGWIVLVVTGIWSVLLLASTAVAWVIYSSEGSDPGEVAFLIFMAFFVFLAVWVLLFQLTLNDACRVYYTDVEGGLWGEQSFVYFRASSANQVLAALETGDVQSLAWLRSSGPNVGGPAWQSYTTMTLTVCPGHPEQPGYLHLKEIVMSGGPIFSKKVHSSMGRAPLRHVRLDPDDLRRLVYLFPDALSGVALPRESDQLAGSAVGAYQTPAMPLPPPPPVFGTGVNLGPAQPTGPARGDTAPGLPAGAPAILENPGGSYIRLLDRSDWRRFRIRWVMGYFSFVWAAIVLFAYLGIAASYFDDAAPGGKTGPLEIVAITGFILFAVLTLVLCFQNGWMARQLALRALKSRRSRLFGPDARPLLLGVEDARTYQITKPLADDYAVVRVSSEGVDIEMSRFRVHLVKEEVHLELHESPPHFGLKICSMVGGYPFAITVSEADANSVTSFSFTHPRDKALGLWRRVYDRLEPGGAR